MLLLLKGVKFAEQGTARITNYCYGWVGYNPLGTGFT